MKKLLTSSFIQHYGMVIVLCLLMVVFSLLTISEQNPTGADAGRQVAWRILSQHDDQANVVIVVRDTDDDRDFANVAKSTLEAGNATVLQTVTGNARDARLALESIVKRGDRIDAIAANDVTAKWTVYDKFPSVGSEKCVTPMPYTWPNFLKLSNLVGVANQTAIYAIIAIGMTMVIITAGIDLSVGSLVALASVCCSLAMTRLFPTADAGILIVLLGIFLGIAVCALAGTLNGLLITRFELPPFIVTLGMMLMASGLAFRLSAGRSIGPLPESFDWVGKGRVPIGDWLALPFRFEIPYQVILMFVLYLLAEIVMSRMVFGRYVYAVGGNEEAARLSGVPVKKVILIVYAICGALAGLGGVILTSQLSSGDPKYGLMYELEVIAAVVVGGTSLMGGRGKIFGTLIGAFIIAVIKNGMNLTDVDPFNQKIVLGAVLTGAVLLDTLKLKVSK